MEPVRVPALITDKLRPHAKEALAKVKKFVEEEFMFNRIPADEVFEAQLALHPDQRWKSMPPILEDLKKRARELGLWNLWMHSHFQEGPGFTNVEYTLMCETMGRSHVAPEAMNCSAPDTGNMELLAKYGTEAQKQQWLRPLLDGKIRSAYVMTEIDVAASDAKNLALEMRREGNEYVLNGVKWWISSAGDQRCQLYIIFARSNPNDPNPTKRHSIILVDSKTPGIEVIRPLRVFGFDDAPTGHCEVHFNHVRVPASNIILGEGQGFEIMQGRMGPGRIHHCMRAIGCAERGLEYLIARANKRMAHEAPLANKGVVADWIARSRIEIDAARLLVLNAADKIDSGNAKDAMSEIAMAKIYVPNVALAVLDRAIQTHGAAGLCQDFPLARIWTYLRTVRIADGPDEAHAAQLARTENKRHRNM
ncbi:hypothetical protein G647_09925 [Cladophialophora carrionii CBS 160.54]|uniref:Acyl-CoA dehydrogenase n=1 Tax=Cladophialophora carrionii CBS 160.54 TaxID=1279043 RepID=V9DMQ4_9EURO|nr:uncharacterized protein G647_09925 [Cladophialophora carrionii CBS 160.54]ETI27242.1 hypothetical protein G647_09925 [Cladophialophora carrionii CBS 160.54]